MTSHSNQDQAAVPISSLVLGYGPMAPLALAATGVWVLTSPWSDIVTKLSIIWGGLILVFVAGVRRGYGFGDAKASIKSEIATMLVYFVAGGLSLVIAAFGGTWVALGMQVGCYLLVAVLDRRAALDGDAPLHVARLRGPQMVIAASALAVVLAHALTSATR